MKPGEFWEMTFAEVELACKGYEIRMAKSREVDRLIAGILANVYRGKGSPIPLEKVFPLYTDSLRKVEIIKTEDYGDVLKSHGKEGPTAEQRQMLINRKKWQNRDLKRNWD